MRYPYALPPLPYGYDALEGVIDAETLHFHHDKHLAAYVENLNKALEFAPELQAKTLTQLLKTLYEVPADLRTAVINNGGGVYNHLLYFDGMAPGGPEEPIGPLASAIQESFGGLEGFREEMTKAAMGQFGSGYAWLVCNDEGALSIVKTANQDCPLSQGLWPILNLDVWEHAYYLQYQNRRAEYVGLWFSLINWNVAEKRYVR